MPVSREDCKNNGKQAGEDARAIAEKVGSPILKGEKLRAYAHDCFDELGKHITSRSYYEHDVEQRAAWVLGYILGYEREGENPPGLQQRRSETCSGFWQNFWDLLFELFEK